MGGSSKKQTVGYKYHLGLHMVLCHGPVDVITRIRFDGKTAWTGYSTGGRINVSAPGLFGGEKREGGVSGALDFEQGGPAQEANDYLQARLGGLIPAFRQVAAVVFRQFYMGMNPYLKRIDFRVQRVHTRQDGLEQWYDERAEVPLLETLDSVLSFPEFESSWETNAPDKFQIIDGMIANTLVNAENTDYWRHPVPNFTITRLYCEFVLIDRDLGDPLGIRFDTEGGQHLFSFMPQAENAFDSQRRPHINYWTSAQPIYDEELEEGVPYSFEAIMDLGAGTFQYFLRQGTALLSSGTASLPAGTPDYVTFGRTSNAQPERTGIAGYSYLELSGSVAQGDMNPAHIIRECITDPDWGMGYPESDVSDASFIAAADTLFDEGMGISLLWEQSTPIESFVQDIIRHVDGALIVDPGTGLFTLKLIRDDYDKNQLPVLGPSNVMRVEKFTRPAFDDLVNQITVQYWDSSTGETAAVTVTDDALVQMQGVVISETVQYPGFTNQALAARVAQRDLHALSTPLVTCTLYAHRSAGELSVGDPFILSWPEYDIESMVMRATRIGYGDHRSGVVMIECTQDVFSTPQIGVTGDQPSEWQDPAARPLPPPVQMVFEAPYYEVVQTLGDRDAQAALEFNPQAGYLIAACARPSDDAVAAQIHVDSGNGFEDSGVVDFSPHAFLAEDLPREAGPSTVAINGGVGLDDVEIGTHAQIGQELVRVDALSDTEITIGRGVLDTVPDVHKGGDAVLFWDVYAAGDGVEYVDSEQIDVKLLTVTGAGVLPLGSAPDNQVVFDQRAVRPYPPGGFRVNGDPYPISIPSASTTIEWAHRDRLQQTGATLVDHSEGDIGPEAGTTYTLRIYGENGALGRTVTGIEGTSYIYAIEDEINDFELPGGDVDFPLSGLVSYWGFDDGTGSTAADSHSTNDISITGAPDWSTDRKLGSHSLDFTTGTDPRAATGIDMHGEMDWTLAFWVKRSSGDNNRVVAARVRDENNYWLLIHRSDRNGLTLQYANNAASASYIWNNNELTMGAWTHVVWTKSGTTHKLYFDGIEVDSGTISAGLDGTNLAELYIGARNPVVTALSWAGRIDDTALWGRPLTLEEIQTLYSEGSGLPYPTSAVFRESRLLRFELESARDGLASRQHINHTVYRAGWGVRWGNKWGGSMAAAGWGMKWGRKWGGATIL